MVRPRYIPDRGDVVWITLDPVAGHEQGGRRPAYVLTLKEYNQKTDLMIVCPITKSKKGYTGEISVQGEKISGVLLADHIQSRDWVHRDVEFIENMGVDFHAKVLHRISLAIS